MARPEGACCSAGGADLDHFVVVAALQAVVLLQVAQLYGVLAALAPDPSTGEGPELWPAKCFGFGFVGGLKCS